MAPRIERHLAHAPRCICVHPGALLCLSRLRVMHSPVSRAMQTALPCGAPSLFDLSPCIRLAYM